MGCVEHLRVIYREYSARTGARLAFVERALSCPAEIVNLSDDERRNESATYQALSNECRSFLDEFYEHAMRMMHGQPFGDCGDALDGLAFLQEVAATTLWRHRCSVGDKLASFAREFDRLDVPAERERLHARAQTH